MTVQNKNKPTEDMRSTEGQVVPLTARSEVEASYVAVAEAVIADRKSRENAHLLAARRAALEAFAVGGFPTRRLEAWKFTDLRSNMAGARKNTAHGTALPPPLFHKMAGVKIDLCGGSGIASELAGMDVCDFSEAGGRVPGWARDMLIILPDVAGWQDHPVAALGFACAPRVVAVRVPADRRVALPLSLLHEDDNGMPGTALLMDVEEGGRLTLLEDHRTTGFSSRCLVVRLGARAHLDHYKCYQGTGESRLVSFTRVLCEAGAQYSGFSLNLGGGLARNETFLSFQGEGGQTMLKGASLLKGQDHGDTSLRIDHDVPRCSSREVFKTVLAGKAHGVFQGKVVVAPHAQHTDADQSSKALLLSDGCDMSSKPELEIYADDVKCSHGAASGALDEDALFYLRSRGLPLAEATQMLISAFVGDLLEDAKDPAVAGLLRSAVDDWLEQNRQYFAKEDERT